MKISLEKRKISRWSTRGHGIHQKFNSSQICYMSNVSIQLNLCNGELVITWPMQSVWRGLNVEEVGLYVQTLKLLVNI